MTQRVMSPDVVAAFAEFARESQTPDGHPVHHIVTADSIQNYCESHETLRRQRDALWRAVSDYSRTVLATWQQTPDGEGRELADVVTSLTSILSEHRQRWTLAALVSHGIEGHILVTVAERDQLCAMALARQEPTPTCATCFHWLPENRETNVRAQCNMGVSGSTAFQASHHPYPITRREFGCTLHKPDEVTP